MKGASNEWTLLENSKICSPSEISLLWQPWTCENLLDSLPRLLTKVPEHQKFQSVIDEAVLKHKKIHTSCQISKHIYMYKRNIIILLNIRIVSS